MIPKNNKKSYLKNCSFFLTQISDCLNEFFKQVE